MQGIAKSVLEIGIKKGRRVFTDPAHLDVKRASLPCETRGADNSQSTQWRLYIKVDRWPDARFRVFIAS